ncbi:RPA-related protein RADX [Protopterus annectens]|uniref:RPA-related protein RADX n=1 Tax=Protopterus annectens TaxID=7888 RepID=UPI001CFA63A2|nr:RPA-related protein RADX [Protopterus annectens]
MLGAELCCSRAVATLEGNSTLVKILKKVVHSTSLRINVQDCEPLAVVAVQRYLSDTCLPSQPGPSQVSASYLYDVTLTDGELQTKCFLAPDLNAVVHTNSLRCGIEIKIKQCCYVYDEKRINNGFLSIEKVELGSNISPILCSISDLSALPNVFSLQGNLFYANSVSQTPLVGGRKYYLSLWNNEDPYGEMRNVFKQLELHITVDASKIITLSNLEMIWRSRLKYPPLLVRIMHKSRLRYFGKPGKKMDVPYQVYFEVADCSGMMSMVMWNDLCLEWYNSIYVGSVLFIQQYTVKPSYQHRTWPTPGDPQMKVFKTVEVCLNPREPASELYILPEKNVKPEWQLPKVRYHFISRVDLDHLPHNYTCDVIGLVIFVGRCERLRKKEGAEDFWLYRWVHIIDGTADKPFILELFSTSQPDVFEHIHPMAYLVCTQMRVVRDPDLTSSTQPYLTTSNESQLFITGLGLHKSHKGQPYTTDPKVKAFIQWTKTQNENDLLQRTVIGGYYHFPPPPVTFAQFCKDNKAETVLTSSNEVMKMIANLHYREHKRIAFLGSIASVRYIHHSCTAKVLPAMDVEEEEIFFSARSSPPSSQESDGLAQKSPTQKRKSELHQETEPLTAPIMQLPDFSPSSKFPFRRKRQQRYQTEDHDTAAVYQQSSAELNNKENEENNPNLQSCSRLCGGESHVCSVHAVQQPEVSSDNVWESDIWSEVKGQLSVHLHYGCLLPESIPRKFDYHHRELLVQQLLLHPAKHQCGMHTWSKQMEEHSSLLDHGHFEVTILGINRQFAIDTVFLPVTSTEDHRKLGLLSDLHSNTLLSCVNLGYVSQQQTTGTHESSVLPPPDSIVQTADELNRQHFICILDVCHLGEATVEVFLNQLYNPLPIAQAV